MMKRIVLALLLFALPAQAAGLKEQAIFTNERVASTGTATSAAIRIAPFDTIESFGVRCTDDGAGTPEVRLEFAVCSDDSTCGGFNDYNDIVNSTNVDFTTNPELFHVVYPPAISGPYAKFKLTGLGSNPADTDCWVSLYYRKDPAQ